MTNQNEEETKNRIRSITTSIQLDDEVKIERLCALFDSELQTAKEEIIRLQSNDYFYVELDKKNELLTQQNKQLEEKLKVAKNKNEKLHAFLHNKFNWSKNDVWIRNYLSSYIFDEEMVSDGKEYISPLKQILDLTQQNKQMREALEKIRSYELQSLDIDWDEYEVGCRETDYSPIITFCEVGLGEQDVI